MAEGKKTNFTTSTPAPQRRIINDRSSFTEKLSAISKYHSPSVVKKLNMMQLVINAIKSVGLPKKGASLPSIKKWLLANSEPTARSQNAALKKAIIKGLESGSLIRPSHSKDAHGIAGWFALAPTLKKRNSSPSQKVPYKKVLKPTKSNGKKPLKPPKTNLKNQNNDHETNGAKKESRNAPSRKKVEETELQKKQAPSKAVAKKRTKKSPTSSPTDISKKGAKKNTEVSKIVGKKAVQNKHPSSSEVRSLFSSNSDSDESIEKPKQESKTTRQKANNSVDSKREKPIKSKKEHKMKQEMNLIKNKTEKIEILSENILPSELKDESSHEDMKQPKTKKVDQANPGNNKCEVKRNRRKLAEKKSDIIRKDMSDTEIDTRPNEPKPRKSYASDTEVELSRSSVYQSSKKKRNMRSRLHTVSKSVINGIKNAMENTKTSKPQIQSRTRKPK